MQLAIPVIFHWQSLFVNVIFDMKLYIVEAATAKCLGYELFDLHRLYCRIGQQEVRRPLGGGQTIVVAGSFTLLIQMSN